jgi:hypothetical protein
MAVRLRNRLLMDLSADVPTQVLFGGRMLREVAQLVCQQLTLRSVLATDGAELDETDTEVFRL